MINSKRKLLSTFCRPNYTELSQVTVITRLFQLGWCLRGVDNPRNDSIKIKLDLALVFNIFRREINNLNILYVVIPSSLGTGWQYYQIIPNFCRPNVDLNIYASFLIKN